jgi:hypothetical protein
MESEAKYQQNPDSEYYQRHWIELLVSGKALHASVCVCVEVEMCTDVVSVNISVVNKSN